MNSQFFNVPVRCNYFSVSLQLEILLYGIGSALQCLTESLYTFGQLDFIELKFVPEWHGTCTK